MNNRVSFRDAESWSGPQQQRMWPSEHSTDIFLSLLQASLLAGCMHALLSEGARYTLLISTVSVNLSISEQKHYKFWKTIKHHEESSGRPNALIWSYIYIASLLLLTHRNWCMTPKLCRWKFAPIENLNRTALQCGISQKRKTQTMNFNRRFESIIFAIGSLLERSWSTLTWAIHNVT